MEIFFKIGGQLADPDRQSYRETCSHLPLQKYIRGIINRFLP